MRYLINGAAVAILVAAIPVAARGQIYPFYYGHNYGTHYVKDKNHDYWHDYSPDRDRYFGDPGYEAVDDPDTTNDAQADSQAHFKGYDYDDDGFGYQYRPQQPLPRGQANYGKPDARDIYGVGPDLFEPDYINEGPRGTVGRARVAERRSEAETGQSAPSSRPRLRSDRSMDKFGRYRL